MSDEDVIEEVDEDEGYKAPDIPSGYIPGAEALPGQNVGDRGEVIPPPEEILEQQREMGSPQVAGSGVTADEVDDEEA